MKTDRLIEKLDAESRFFISTVTNAGSDDAFQEYLEVAKLLYDVSHPKPFPGGISVVLSQPVASAALSPCI